MSDYLILGVVQLLFPFAVGFVVYLYKRIVSSLPAAQQEAIKSVVRTGVYAVEQQGSAMNGPDKKQEAVRWITQVLNTRGIKADPVLIDGLIEQAVYAVNQSQVPDPQATQVGIPVVKPQ